MYELRGWGYAGYIQIHFPTEELAQREAWHLISRWGFKKENIEIGRVK